LRETTISSDENFTWNLVIACVFQNEAPFLREWIEFHRLLGVQHFILVNDRSNDDYEARLRPYTDQEIVTLIEYDCPQAYRGERWISYQRSVLDTMCRKLAGKARWLALIDVDEFLVPEFDETLVDLLRRHERSGAVWVRWEPFGTSYIPKLDPSRLIIEQLLLKRHFYPGSEMLGKSIVKPHCVKRVDIHRSELNAGYTYHEFDPDNVQPNPSLKLHHYWSRDEHFLFDIKLVRAAELGCRLNEDMERFYKHLFNDVVDTTMERYYEAVRQRLSAL
jgi:hypothetical protein